MQWLPVGRAAVIVGRRGEPSSSDPSAGGRPLGVSTDTTATTPEAAVVEPSGSRLQPEGIRRLGLVGNPEGRLGPQLVAVRGQAGGRAVEDMDCARVVVFTVNPDREVNLWS
jgi:hypothetical protein